MTKKAPEQIEMELKSFNSEKVDTSRSSNVVDAREFKIRTHTERVAGKLRADGLLDPIRKN